MVTREYALDDINQGFDDMLGGRNIRGAPLPVRIPRYLTSYPRGTSSWTAMTVTEHIADTLVRARATDRQPVDRRWLGRLARFSVRRRRWVIAVWLVVAPAAAPSSSRSPAARPAPAGKPRARWRTRCATSRGPISWSSAPSPRRRVPPEQGSRSCRTRQVDRGRRPAPGRLPARPRCRTFQLPPEAGMISPTAPRRWSRSTSPATRMRICPESASADRPRPASRSRTAPVSR